MRPRLVKPEVNQGQRVTSQHLNKFVVTSTNDYVKI